MFDPDLDQLHHTNNYINIQMITINSLPIFIKILTSALQCFAFRTFVLGRHNANGNLMVDLCLLSCYLFFIIRKEGTRSAVSR